MMEMLKDRWRRFRDWSGWRQLWGWLKRFFVALLLVLLAIVALLVVYFWEDIHCWAYGEKASNGETLRSLALAVGACLAAFIGLPLAIWRGIVANSQAKAANRQAETANRQAKIANRQAETSERGLRNERYQKGAEMLGSDTLATRLGGIYAFERLAREHPEEHHVEIMELLCAFVRHPTKTEAESEAVAAGAPKKKCPPDVEAAAKAVGKCRRRLSDEGRLKDIERDLVLDLTGAHLEGAYLEGAHLEGADLARVHLESADLNEAHLEGAYLVGAHLARAHLESADLEGAFLEDATLTGANLAGADLTDADPTDADLTGAHLARAMGLKQDMLDGAQPSPPPESLPEDLSWPFEEGEDGQWRLRPQP